MLDGKKSPRQIDQLEEETQDDEAAQSKRMPPQDNNLDICRRTITLPWDRGSRPLLRRGKPEESEDEGRERPHWAQEEKGTGMDRGEREGGKRRN